MAQERVDDKSSGRPNAVLVAPVHDFGEIEYDEEVVHEFEIRNDGDRTLELFESWQVVQFRLRPLNVGRLPVPVLGEELAQCQRLEQPAEVVTSCVSSSCVRFPGISGLDFSWRTRVERRWARNRYQP